MDIETISQSLAHRTPITEDSVGALQAGVSILLAPGPELLLIRRAEHPDDPWSGQIGLPGGTKENSDANLLVTAVRETQEEIEVSLPKASLLGQLDDFRPRRKSLPDVLIRPFVFALEEKPKTNCSDEVQYCVWSSMQNLLNSQAKREIEITDGKRSVETYLAGEREVIWGITYRILSGFFAALKLNQKLP